MLRRMSETRYARSGDAYIAYEVEGEGPIDLIIVTEGFIPCDMMFDEPHLARVLRRLASFTRLIRFDRRGIGLSDPVAASAPPTLEQWCDDALAVLDAVGSERAAVLAANESGLVALVLGAMHPDRMHSVIVINTFAFVPENFAHLDGARITDEALERWLDELVTPSDDGGSSVEQFAPSLAGDAQFRKWWDDAGRRGASPSTARALMRVLLGSDVRAVLPAVRMPTLVLHYAGDPVLPPIAGRYIAEKVPNVKYVEVDGVDDVWWAGNADAALEEIEEFLTGSRGSAEVDRVLATVLFTDIVASTDQLTEVGDRKWRDVLDTYEGLARRQLDRFAGRSIKSTGDGMLATFDGPAREPRRVRDPRCRTPDGPREPGRDTRGRDRASRRRRCGYHGPRRRARLRDRGPERRSCDPHHSRPDRRFRPDLHRSGRARAEGHRRAAGSCTA